MIGAWRRSLRVRIITFNALILAALLIAAGVVQQVAVRTGLLRSIDRELARRTQPLVSSPPRGGDSLRGPPGQEGFYRPRLLDEDGRVVSPPGVERPFDQDGWQLALLEGEHYSTVSVGGEELRVLSRRYGPSERPGVIQAPYPLAELHRALAELTRIQLLLLPLALLLAALVGAWLTERVLRPTREITEAAQKIGAQHLSERLDERGDDEFARLAATFNQMLGRLEAAFDEQRRFTGDASHELQTPLAVIKANTSLSLSTEQTRESMIESLREIEAASDQMSTLVQDLLLLARSDSGQLAKERVLIPVAVLIARAIARVAHRFGPGIRVAAIDAGLEVRGNEDELLRLFANLLENALRYTPAGGEISISADRSAGAVEITVLDTGCGIAAADLARLGERFFRVSASRARSEGGFGLGLSICMGIARAHGGSIELASELGRGTKVTVRLPGRARDH